MLNFLRWIDFVKINEREREKKTTKRRRRRRRNNSKNTKYLFFWFFFDFYKLQKKTNNVWKSNKFCPYNGIDYVKPKHKLFISISKDFHHRWNVAFFLRDATYDYWRKSDLGRRYVSNTIGFPKTKKKDLDWNEKKYEYVFINKQNERQLEIKICHSDRSFERSSM